MHRIKMYHLRRKVHFVIMSSVFDTPAQINTIYDLKGSLVGRSATEKERQSGGVLKDCDMLDDRRKIHLGSKKVDFMIQLQKDAHFLASLQVMDYSLLVGIHDRQTRPGSMGNSGLNNNNNNNNNTHNGPTGGGEQPTLSVVPTNPASTSILRDSMKTVPVATNNSNSSYSGGGGGSIQPHLPPAIIPPPILVNTNNTMNSSTNNNNSNSTATPGTSVTTTVGETAHTRPYSLPQQGSGGAQSHSNTPFRRSSINQSSDVTTPGTAQRRGSTSRRGTATEGDNNSNISNSNNRGDTQGTTESNGHQLDFTRLYDSNNPYDQGLPVPPPPPLNLDEEEGGEDGTHHHPNTAPNTMTHQGRERRRSSNSEGERPLSAPAAFRAGDRLENELFMVNQFDDNPMLTSQLQGEGGGGNDSENEEDDYYEYDDLDEGDSDDGAGVGIGMGTIAEGEDEGGLAGEFGPDNDEGTLEAPPNTINTQTNNLSNHSNFSGNGNQMRVKYEIVYGNGITTRRPWTRRKDLGINSREKSTNKRGNEIYFVGIIDILQEYNMGKRMETMMKVSGPVLCSVSIIVLILLLFLLTGIDKRLSSDQFSGSGQLCKTICSIHGCEYRLKKIREN
jgi:hypothetical protein